VLVAELLNELLIDKEQAHRTIAGRPYSRKIGLRERQIVDPHTYTRIQGRSAAKVTTVR
jgi:hypothetical protein